MPNPTRTDPAAIAMPDTDPPVTVLGLGSMGAALARAVLTAGAPTTVWNRTAERSAPLAADGATVAASAASAVAASPLVIVCLRDHDAVREVFGAVEPATFHGRTVVNLTSTTPDQARDTARWAHSQKINYLTGAIMVPTPLVGSPEALILYAGPAAELERHRSSLHHLAGQQVHLGDDHGLAPLHDVAMLEIFFAGMTSFLHAVAMTTAHGVSAGSFLPYAQQMLSILPPTLEAIAADVDRGEYPGDEDNIAMELAALEHITKTSVDSGADSRLPGLIRDLARETVAAGDGHLAWSRVVETIRGPRPRPVR